MSKETLHEALLYEKKGNTKIKCCLCARRCLIKEGSAGFCLVRKNIGGVLYTLNYGKAVSACVDPIGKKPLFHFNPGAIVLSFAAVGCNFRCQFCDNWMISQEKEIKGKKFLPEDAIKTAKKYKCQGISYSYTEPTIFFEYALETAKLAKKEGIFNTFVTNGYMTPETIKKISPYLDAITVDFKASGEASFYKNCSAVQNTTPIFETLKEIKLENIHIEITNLVVPKIGDSLDKIKNLATWIKNYLGEDIPLHLLRFHPDYKMTTTPATSLETLEKAYVTAKESGLNYTYIGNVPGHPAENTYCPNCNELLIRRHSYEIIQWKMENMICPVCNQKIPIKGNFYSKRSFFPYSVF